MLILTFQENGEHDLLFPEEHVKEHLKEKEMCLVGAFCGDPDLVYLGTTAGRLLVMNFRTKEVRPNSLPLHLLFRSYISCTDGW